MSHPVSGPLLFPEEVSVRRDPDLPPHTVDERRVCILLECFLLLLFVYLLLSLTSGFLYAIREAIVNDLVEYDLNGSDYVSCIVSEEYKDTAKYFIFIDIFILFLIPLIIIVSNYARVREYGSHPLFAFIDRVHLRVREYIISLSANYQQSFLEINYFCGRFLKNEVVTIQVTIFGSSCFLVYHE